MYVTLEIFSLVEYIEQILLWWLDMASGEEQALQLTYVSQMVQDLVGLSMSGYKLSKREEE